MQLNGRTVTRFTRIIHNRYAYATGVCVQRSRDVSPFPFLSMRPPCIRRERRIAFLRRRSISPRLFHIEKLGSFTTLSVFPNFPSSWSRIGEIHSARYIHSYNKTFIREDASVDQSYFDIIAKSRREQDSLRFQTVKVKRCCYLIWIYSKKADLHMLSGLAFVLPLLHAKQVDLIFSTVSFSKLVFRIVHASL